ncbi:hypothetical protein EON80_06750 [bacterium]|nr:MAG: hypothetical protein EON80_06750 [bacterium]
MNQIFSAIPSVLLATLVASVQGACCYWLFRKSESKWTPLPYGFVLLGLMYAAGAGYLGLVIAALAIYMAPALLGGWFHRRSGGISKQWSEAVLIVTLATGLSNISALVISAFWATNPSGRAVNEPALWSYLVGSYLYPPLTPLGLWLWQSSRVRPGIDEAFEHGLQ